MRRLPSVMSSIAFGLVLALTPVPPSTWASVGGGGGSGAGSGASSGGGSEATPRPYAWPADADASGITLAQLRRAYHFGQLTSADLCEALAMVGPDPGAYHAAGAKIQHLLTEQHIDCPATRPPARRPVLPPH